MKAYIELKNGFWTINGKRSKDWTLEEKALMNKFLKIVKSEEQEQQTKPLIWRGWGGWVGAFFRKQPIKSYWLTQKDIFLLIKQI